MFSFVKVTGNSLSPLVQEGDFVLVIKIPFFAFRGAVKVKPGDLVVLRHPHYGRMIKQVDWISNDGTQVFVIGFHPDSTDSRHFGPIEMSWVTGKIIWHIRQPGQ